MASPQARFEMRQHLGRIENVVIGNLIAAVFAGSEHVRSQMKKHGFHVEAPEHGFSPFGFNTLAGGGQFATRLAIDEELQDLGLEL